MIKITIRGEIMTYDLIVIGGGPAGYLAAERAGHAGLTTLLIEKRSLGGVCLNEGCIPTKTLLYSAKIYDNARNGEKYGVTVSDIRLDHGAVVKRKNKIVRSLTVGVKAKMRKSNVTVVEGEASIAGRCPEGYKVKAGDSIYTGQRILIATGSVPVLPSIPGIKEGLETGFVLTNREILDLTEVPGSLVIVGGGVIGLEMASYFRSAGSNVTVIEMLDHIAGYTDSDIAQILLKNYQKKGIRFLLGTRVTRVEQNTVICETGDQTLSIEADKVLISIGRKAASEGLGLETVGVHVEDGRIKVDDRCRTNIPDIYAAGDVNGISMLAHTAYREAEVAVSNMLGNDDIVRYNAIPYVIYTNPEVAGVGETEESAAKKGIDYEAVKLPMNYSGRYMAENEGGDGICKVLVEKESRRLIGLHMIGNYSSEIIYGAALMIERELAVDDIKKLVFPHPTVSEIIRETIFEL